MSKRKRRDLFDSIVAPAARHVAYERLRTSPYHVDARSLLTATARRMGDPDGRLITDFQGEAFHARLFELACFAYLEEQGLSIDRTNPRPDFLVSRGGRAVCSIEAVTASPTNGQRADIAIAGIEALSPAEILEKCDEDFPIRIGRALDGKLKHRYWELPHCQRLPFVIAVGPFYEPGSTQYVDENLARFLYGLDQYSDRVDEGCVATREVPVLAHAYAGKRMRSNLFEYPSAEHLSAVLYCNQWTVPRFVRLAAHAHGWHGANGTRSGSCLGPGDTVVIDAVEYEHALGDPDVPRETWSQGVTVFHNPRAIHPLPLGALSGTSTFMRSDGRVERTVSAFHPLTSMMQVDHLAPAAGTPAG